ncbi:MAG TPA: TIM44-like domain-containing protein [Candidatus Polarisedimenticolaceae bacterium]|nr:TIM44-like domain-containing protein [Candidatus Polarisedimenticolaceae bacterium]
MIRRLPGIAVLVLSVTAAAARVGGGGGYSGGGGDHGGGGDFGLVFGLVRILLWLVFSHPLLGIPLVILILVVLSRASRAGTFRSGVAERPTVYPLAAPRREGPVNLTPVRATDPMFSEPVFLDFAQLVYVRAHELRGKGSREPLAPWMSAAAIDTLFADRQGLDAVDDVVIGAVKVTQASTETGFVRLDVRFEANMTETRGGARAQILTAEIWTFRRKAGVRSPVPARMRALGCAGCGSTLEPKSDGTCPSCGGVRVGGATQWEVGAIPYGDRRPLTAPELSLADGDGVESGTDRPIVFDPRLPAAKRTLEGKYPGHDWSAFEARVRAAFLALQKAWSSRTWEDARPYETDALFQSHRFWMERYRAFGLVNHVDDAAVSSVVVAKIDADAFYDAVTVRIYASARDWTEDAHGKIVGGDRSRSTMFSEYWTFLRAVPGSIAPLTSCPTCGAALPASGGATVCPSCGSKLEGDSLDWVASRIEQDDAYAG